MANVFDTIKVSVHPAIRDGIMTNGVKGSLNYIS